MNVGNGVISNADQRMLARLNDCTKPIDAADRNGILNLIKRLVESAGKQPDASGCALTTNQSRADALTDEQRQAINLAKSFMPDNTQARGRAHAILEALAAPPAEQSAAAPIEKEQPEGIYPGNVYISTELHPDTGMLVRTFTRALSNKLLDAQRKYGYSNNWMRKGWADECRAELMRHIHKGDPRDVAAYCAFLWYHNESTAPAPTDERAARVAEGLEACDWSGVPLGNKAIIKHAVEVLRGSARTASVNETGAPSDGQICPHCDCMRPLHDLDCPVAISGSKSAPAQSDERVAFESLKGAWQSMPPFDVFCAGWQAARAAFTNETADERAAWEKVLHWSKYIKSRLDTKEAVNSSISGPACDAGERAVWMESLAREMLARAASANETGAAEQDDLIGRLLLAGRHPDFAICMEAAKALREARATSANATADERAAFLEWFCADTPEKQREMDKESADDCLRRGHANDRLLGSWEGFQFGLKLARAASANETGAEGAEPVAQWQYRIRTPGYDGDWHNCNPETAKRLQEQPYAEDHDVRALYAAPQPPAQADAREGLTDERIAHIAAAHTNSVVEFDRLLKFARALLKGADHAE